jgi:hypothetical protein
MLCWSTDDMVLMTVGRYERYDSEGSPCGGNTMKDHSTITEDVPASQASGIRFSRC